ncbi:hypothetical protein AL755_13110 [Arthrobacter sp. ERGS1:01]|nr:hypothetical protein AL755_13110 [Arthrobacter sp. ERGS1:01]
MVVKPDFVAGSISGAADRVGVTMISTELAGRGTVNRRVLAEARTGLHRLLAHVGVLPIPSGSDDSASHSGRDADGSAGADDGITYLELRADSAVMARGAGLFEPSVDLGQHVAVGDLVGRVHFIEELDRPWQEYRAHLDGLVCTLRHPTLVQTGTTLVNIGVPLRAHSRLEN